MENNQSISHKTEIDGIRAIAVISVLLYHLDIQSFKNGFLGVDIFFVISGYLITKILLKNYKNPNFLYYFYIKRARRLFPALLFTLFLTLIFCYIIFLPSDLRDFGQSLIAVNSISSNFLFFIEDDYFTNASEVKPLLHTWSLSIEEQFYIIFSFIFYLVFLKKKIFKISFLFIFFLSLLGSHISGLFHFNPNNIVVKDIFINQSIFFSFFSPLGRFWEFLLGSIIAIYNLDNLKKYFTNKIFYKNFLACSGFFIILYMLLNQKKIISPSLEILPCLMGVGLIIMFANKKDTIVGKILSVKPSIYIGKISYSIYLIHFPIIVILKYQNIDLQFHEKIFLIFLIIFTSHLMWRYVEQPFRNESKISNKNFFVLILIPIILFVKIGLIFHFTNGLEKKYVDRLSVYEQSKYYKVKELFKSEDNNIYHSKDFFCKKWTSNIDQLFIKNFSRCVEKYNKGVIVLGDSHALDVFNATSKVLNEKFIIGIGKVGCRVFEQQKCDYQKYKDFIKNNKKNIKYVLFVHAGRSFHKDGRFFELKKKEFFETENYLNSFDEDIKIIWLGFNVEPGIKPIYLVNENRLERFENMKIYTLDSILKNRKNQKYKYFSRIDVMNYSYKEKYIINEKITFSDGDHWSNFGELYFGKIIFQSNNFKRLVEKND